MIKILGKYLWFISRMFVQTEASKSYYQRTVDELHLIGVKSIFLIAVVSVFFGAVSAVQTAFNLVSPMVPPMIIGTVIQSMAILELSPTIIVLVLAGKVGSHIASEIGNMRISEQLDALEVMGINSITYVVAPKVIAGLIMVPILVVFSMFLILFAGMVTGELLNLVTVEEYILGIRYDFKTYNVIFGLIKSMVFAFLITTISSYLGYYVKGGALQVGKISTQSVTINSIMILIWDFLLAKLLL